MRPALLHCLVCPRCREAFRLRIQDLASDGEIWNGLLTCTCGESAPILDGIPRLGGHSHATQGSPEDLRGQVQGSFSFKWQRFPAFGFDRSKLREFYARWFCRKLGFTEVEEFEAFLSGKRVFLDAGTGLGGKVETFCRINPHAMAVGVDLSASVVPAFANTRRWPNAHILQADLMRLPFPERYFDLIVSDGVLHHTPDPRKAFHALLLHLARGGEIAIHVYKRLGPIREYCDDLLRRHSVTLSPEACWEFSVPFTKLGEALGNLKATIEVPENLPILGIKAGRYDLQRFIYHHFFKCFWNPDFTFEENNMVNFDWYHPALASRHTEEEVVGWFREAGLTEIRVARANENGVSVVGRRP